MVSFVDGTTCLESFLLSPLLSSHLVKGQYAERSAAWQGWWDLHFSQSLEITVSEIASKYQPSKTYALGGIVKVE